ncbi:ABC transporter permease subunit [Nostocoides sp. F2B08]|uniref:carbohydrate ABC transporter permease n=1 Tax=Nostocoides sp. F2B08 TaxID=2653936 RepID=UPI001262FE2A|nr:carbohydrate ABC transporter permease [Tetrasphaera sp. F2B08]KAB7742407.1 ABC transporter permease subunit [Tetrasphaera sp. F2B08]
MSTTQPETRQPEATRQLSRTVDDGNRLTRAGRGKKSAVYLVLVFFALLYVFPFFIQVATSFKTNADAVNNPLSLIPDPFTTAAFERLAETDYPTWFRNSVVVTLLVTAGRVFFVSLAGYALARLKFRGREALFTAVLAVLAVPGIVLLIPKFLILNYLGIYNTFPALFVPLLVDAAGVFIMKQFFETIPPSVEEAARIDGAGTFRIFWSVVLPMAKPALITITILSFQGSWNELGHFIIAANDPALFTLTRGVGQLTSGGLGSGSQFPISMAAALLMTIPTAMVFIVFQRFFTQGANVGAEKG